MVSEPAGCESNHAPPKVSGMATAAAARANWVRHGTAVSSRLGNGTTFGCGLGSSAATGVAGAVTVTDSSGDSAMLAWPNEPSTRSNSASATKRNCASSSW